jgi:excisionase family DNA binding protein
VSVTDTPASPPRATTTSLDELPDVLTVEQYAAVLRIGRKQGYSAVARGEVPGVIRIGRSIRISKAAVVAQLTGDQ